MVNRIDRLVLKLTDKLLFLSCCTPNGLMKAYLVRISFECCKLTLQVFPSTGIAICFSNYVSSFDFSVALKLLPSLCGVRVLSSSLSTSVWVFQSLSPVGDLGNFLKFWRRSNPLILSDFEPELFPLLTLRFPKAKNPNKFITARLSHRGKIVVLGVHHVRELVDPIQKLSNAIFNYCLDTSFSFL